MKQLKILITTQHFYPENFRINSVAKSLVDMGYDVDVITGLPNYPAGKVFQGYSDSWLKFDTYKGINIFRVPIFLRGRASNLSLILNYLSFVISACIFGLWRLKKKYDVVFCYGTSPILQAIPAVLLAKKNQAPLILNVQDLWPESVSATDRIHSPFTIELLSKLIRWIYKRTNVILVQSEAFKETILKLSPASDVIYWPNSVDPIFYIGQSIKMSPSLVTIFSENVFTVTFAGNIGSAQSIKTIVHAAYLLQVEERIKIILLGEGSMREWALQEKSKHGINNLILPGSFPEDQMPSIYQKSSCLLVALTNRPIFNLTIPNKIQGYLALGRPIIGSLNGVSARIIADANAGLVAPAENAKILAERILEMSNRSSKDLEIFGYNGRRYFMKHFEHGQLMTKLDTIIRDVIRL
jgi:glycosyltransferase involved in cell wall biosynthesis